MKSETMNFVLPEITNEDREKFRSYTDGAIQGINLIKSLPERSLFSLVSGRMNQTRRAVLDAMGHNTNGSWITARAAEVLYDRGVIDERKFDSITN